MSDDPLVVYIRLCKGGYARSIIEAKELTAREVLQALSYEAFCNEYESAFIDINRE